MKPQLLCGCVLLCTLISLSSTATVNQSENTKGFFDFGSSEEKDETGHTFSYEFMTPQKILTGCTGTKYPSGDVKTVYYFVDATGQKKFIFPNKAAEVVFPDDNGLPGLTRTQKVYMYEMCFPTPCNVQGSCGPAGSTVGPTGWSLPKFPWLPWGNNNGKGKDQMYTFNLNSQNSASASLSSNSAQIAIGLSGNVEANKQDKKPTTPVKPPVLTSINVGSGSAVSATADGESEADAQVIINTNGNGTQVIVDVGSEADAGATVGVSFTGTGNNGGWKPHTTTTTTTSRPTTRRPTTTTGWAWVPPSSTTTRPTTTTGWAWVPPPTTAKPTTTTSGWAWVPPPSTTAPPTTTSGWTWTPPPTTTTTEPTTSSAPPTTTIPTATTSGWTWTPPPTTTTTTTTEPTTSSAPPTTTIPTTTTSGWTPPPTTAPTTTTSTTPVPTTTTTTAKPCTTSTTETPTTSTTTTEPTTTTTTTTAPAPICNCTNIPGSNSFNPGYAVSSSSSSASSSSSSSSDCDGGCKCCSKCSISSFIEKLNLAGFGNYISKGQAPPPTNQWSSGTWNSYAGPNPWPFGRSEPEHMTRDAQGRITDPEYYKGIPGAIRGDLPVIYYPSCDPNAYFQPAVINYCTDNSAWGKDS